MWIVVFLFVIISTTTRATVTRYETMEYESKASSNATVTLGTNARFTILTSRLIRMEYDPNGLFEDRPSLAVVNRQLPVPSFTSDASSVTTEHLKIEYAGGAFTADSLKVTPIVDGDFSEWTYGQNSSNDEGNLRGTFRTLDGTGNVTLDCNTNGKLPLHCVFGLVSTNGWAILNDTASPMLDDKDDWWTDETGKMLRNQDAIDVYLFAHGHDYAGALADYMKVRPSSIPHDRSIERARSHTR